MRDWRRALLKGIGAPITPGNLRMLSSWQRWEGGHTNNRASFNWLNTTMDAPGALGEINSVGVKKFATFQDGINALSMTLMNGRYDDITQALISGHPYKHDVSRGLQVWVSGRPDGNPAYAQKVMGRSGAPKAPYRQGGGGARGNLALAPDRPGLDWNYDLLKLAFPEDPGFVDQLRAINRSQGSRARSKSEPMVKVGGKTMVLPDQWQGTHVTSGLGWGTKTATDIMGAPGTPVGAPVSGTVVYFHPTGAQGGGSLLLRADDGREYWIGHIANGVKPGTRVKRGQVIASISGDHPRPHVHIDVR